MRDVISRSWPLIGALVLLALPAVVALATTPPRAAPAVSLEAEMAQERSALGMQNRGYVAEIGELRWQQAQQLQQLEQLRKERDEALAEIRQQQHQLRDIRAQLATAGASEEPLF